MFDCTQQQKAAQNSFQHLDINNISTKGWAFFYPMIVSSSDKEW